MIIRMSRRFTPVKRSRADTLSDRLAPSQQNRLMNESEEKPAISLRGVGVQRNERWILRDIDWTAPAGSCAAILGPNGSGKSTLARILTGYIWPTAGEVLIDGHRFGETDLNE